MMKFNIDNTMRRKHLPLLIVLLLCFTFFANAQNKYEREFRIRKDQFPKKALGYIQEKLEDARRIRFYKETDSSKVSYEAKFKRDRLWYSVEFDKAGALEDIEILIKSEEIPDSSFKAITSYLTTNFKKYRIRKIQQQYPLTNPENAEKTVKDAFQNLILPSINYEIIISAKKETVYEQYEVLFDADGNFKSIRKSLPPNYDHVLY